MEPGNEKWAELKLAYENDKMSVDAICASFGISRSKFYGLVKRYGWPRRRREPATDFLGRLMQVLEVGLEQVERRISESAVVDATALSNLTKTYEKVLQLQAIQSVDARTDGPSNLDIVKVRERLMALMHDQNDAD